MVQRRNEILKDLRSSHSNSHRADVSRVMRKTETSGGSATISNLLGDFISSLTGVLAVLQLQPKLVPIPVCVLAPQQTYHRGNARQQGCK